MEAGISLLRGKNIRDRYASNNQAHQKSGIFVEATNEIESQLLTSEKRERERESPIMSTNKKIADWSDQRENRDEGKSSVSKSNLT